MKRLVELHSKSQYPSFYLSDQTCNYSVKLTPLVNANSLYIVISHKKKNYWPKEKETSILVADVRHFDVVKKV